MSHTLSASIQGYIDVQARQLAIENRGNSTVIAEMHPDTRDWLAGLLSGFAERMAKDALALREYERKQA